MQDISYESFQYKHCTPEKTIYNLRRILDSAGIFTVENQWFEMHGKNLCSVQIAVHDNLKVKTSGKGVNRKYALASGLAEFVERIQNLQFTGTISSCWGTEHYDYPDAVEVNIDDIRLLDYFIPQNSASRNLIHRHENNGKLRAIPFYNVFDDRLDYIPTSLLYLRCGSNGMCAGNTPHEAIIQGICEIFEREILYKVYFENQSFPTIPDSFLKQTSSWTHISNIKEMGFEVEVKDCTLNGLLPVIGVIFSKENRSNFCVGSAPDFNIALERCCTEIFQGKDLETMEKYLYEVDRISEENVTSHYLEALKSHTGALPNSLFVNHQEFKEGNLFWSKDLIGHNTLQDLIKMIKKMNLQLLIRDVSFLGFPSYFVYIPGMSEKIPYQPNQAKICDSLCDIKNTLFNLDEAKKDHINFLADFFEKEHNDAKETNAEFHLLKTIGIPYKDHSSFSRVSTEVFLAVLYGRAGNYDRALKVLKMFIDCKPPRSDKAKEALYCFLDILKFLKAGKELKDIKPLLNKTYRKNIIDENIFLLEPETNINNVFGIPTKKQTQNCSGCDICYYKEFKELAEKISCCMKNHHFDQLALGRILSNLQK